jgi:hypothetical protein
MRQKKKEKRGQKPRLSQSSFAFPSTLLASEKKETGERESKRCLSHVTHHLEINKKTFIRFSFSIIFWTDIFASCSHLSNRKYLQY